ncbi:hypothetical protein MKW94_017628 [Papaver nudicaule]|uniref:DNA topoisomerase I n=1 Tax=Papaver nudicaule TaxID=74823 RepID=A0AA41SG74_PAPNU|nr:hypothetical protein [Papaver nudicaule]
MVVVKPKCPDEPRVFKNKNKTSRKNTQLNSVDKSNKLAEQSLEHLSNSEKQAVEDAEDKMNLSSVFVLGGGSSVKNLSSDSEKENHVNQQNGFVEKENKPSHKSAQVMNKRKLDNNDLMEFQSSVKKPKLMDVCVSAEAEDEDEEEEDQEEDDKDIEDEDEDEEEGDEEAEEDKDEEDNILLEESLYDKSKSTIKGNSRTKVVPSASSLPKTNGKKWSTLIHSGVIFPPPYKPHGVKMLYNGQPIQLSPEQEEVATMFAVMKNTDYATEPKFIKNFMNDWKVILGKNHVIKEFELCDFTPIYDWHLNEKEKKKQSTTEEKKIMKEEKLKQEEKYMWAIVDGKKEKVGNFRIEPPGLFRGRGDHPKVGKLKKRIYPKDITINIGKGESIPECPIPGERWKEVKHDNSVAWLACWQDPINPKDVKYVSLGTSSSLKCQSDKEKYEKARLLKDYILDIRANYRKDFTSEDPTRQQIAVAAYLIDKLALRAGNEKDKDEADTVGCCTLKVENVTLLPQTNKLKIKFLGKDSITYENTVEVEPLAYKAIKSFKKGKNDREDLFDKLDTNKLNAHLKKLMPGLTAKVFRTYNASITLDNMLYSTTRGGNLDEKIGVYERANKQVAELCNHQRTESKSHPVQMLKLNEKIVALKNVLDGLENDLARVKKGKPQLKDADGKPKKISTPEALERKMDQTTKKIEKMEQMMRKKEELKTVALGTSKTNYLDPRISVAWCKRHEVLIEKIFQPTLLAKFAWAMDVDPGFRF